MMVTDGLLTSSAAVTPQRLDVRAIFELKLYNILKSHCKKDFRCTD